MLLTNNSNFIRSMEMLKENSFKLVHNSPMIFNMFMLITIIVKNFIIKVTKNNLNSVKYIVPRFISFYVCYQSRNKDFSKRKKLLEIIILRISP